MNPHNIRAYPLPYPPMGVMWNDDRMHGKDNEIHFLHEINSHPNDMTLVLNTFSQVKD